MAQQSRKKNYLLALKWEKDWYFKSFWLSKFINCVTKKGHKEKAEKAVWQSFNLIKKHKKQKPFLVFSEALEIVRPTVGLVAKRVGKKVYQIPIPLKYPKAYKIALKWILDAIKKRKEWDLSERIANEVLAIVFDRRSSTVKKRDEFYALITYNRTYLHYRWI